MRSRLALQQMVGCQHSGKKTAALKRQANKPNSLWEIARTVLAYLYNPWLAPSV